MKLAALISGGKDSMLALHRAVEKYEVVCLIGVIPENPHSYMFHTPNLHLLDAISSCLQLPIYKIPTAGEEELEVDDLARALEVLKVDGIVIGGIESKYQRSRFQRVCNKLGIEMFAPIWHEKPAKLMEKIVEKFDVIIVKVAARGMDEGWLGKKIDDKTLEKLKVLNKKYGVHLAGEGGEYETLVLDAPLYKRRIVVKKQRIKWEGSSGMLEVIEFGLEEKE
jgi:predicted ATP pyrophosphatase (TIGR00289 family)